MAKALQCPDCGHRHPLDDFAAYRTFRCRECRRLLKVPKSAEPSRAAATATLPEVDSGPRDGEGRKVPPSQRGDAIAEQRRDARQAAPGGATVPRSVRVIIWLLAVPGGLIPVLVVGRLAGILTADRAVDVFVGVGLGRFIVPLFVLPVWAALTATLAHVAIEGIARARSQGRPTGSGGRS